MEQEGLRPVAIFTALGFSATLIAFIARADLALALAVASAAKGLALPADLVAIGEVGLAGEIRKVSGVARRLAEAHRLGFKRALVPSGSDVKIDGMEIVEVSRLDQALQRVKITGE